MISKIVKSTSKGQITLPKEWRSQFITDYYTIEADKYLITVKPLSFGNKNQEDVIFDADRDNDGKGVSIDEMINLLQKIKNE